MLSRKFIVSAVILAAAVVLMAIGFAARLHPKGQVHLTGVTLLPGGGSVVERGSCDLMASRCEGGIAIDGRLDEAAWKDGAWYADFYQLGTLSPAQAGTRVKARFDADTLYLAFVCSEPDMAHLIARAKERDGKDVPQDDTVEVFASPTPDAPVCRQWVVSASGALWDAELTIARSGGRENIKYNAGWNSSARCAVERLGDRWQVEMAIPAADLGITTPIPCRPICLLLARERRAGPEPAPPAGKPAARKPPQPKELSSTRRAEPLDRKLGFVRPVDGFPRVTFGPLPVTARASYDIATGRCLANLRLSNPGRSAVPVKVEVAAAPPERSSQKSVSVPAGGETTLTLPYELAGPNYSVRLSVTAEGGLTHADALYGQLPPVLSVQVLEKGGEGRYQFVRVAADTVLGRETRGEAYLTVTATDADKKPCMTESIRLKPETGRVQFRLNIAGEGMPAVTIGLRLGAPTAEPISTLPLAF